MSIDAKKLRELIDAAFPNGQRMPTREPELTELKFFLMSNAPAIADLADEVERLTGALEFYANVREYNAVGGGQFIPILHDQGMRARTALAKPAKGGGE